MAATLPSILLILSVAFTAATIAAAHHPPPSNETKLLIKACANAIGPDDSSLVTFCARDFLGHRAAFLASCDKRKTVAVVLKEAQMRAKAVADLEKKIIRDKSLSTEELRDLKGCWGHLSKVVSSIGNVYANAAVKMPSSNAKVELVGMFDQEAAVKGRCDFSKAGRQRSLVRVASEAQGIFEGRVGGVEVCGSTL